MHTTHTVIDSPLGELTIVATGDAVTGLYFDTRRHEPAHDPGHTAFGFRRDTGFDDVTRQLHEYFSGERTRFDLALAPQGDAFELRVWQLLTEIPYGQTRTYGELARELGNAGLARAVGAANGRNPISLLVPCHRVIGSDGSLTGYGGGLERKRFLLELEEPTAVASGRLF